MNPKKDRPSGFCAKCFDAYMKEVRRKSGGNPNVFVDVGKMTFKCTIPTFTHDVYGNDIVVMTDCANNKQYTLTLKEYQKRRREGTI